MPRAHKSRARRIAFAIARHFETHDRRGAQVRGPVWTGMKPRTLPPVDWFAIDEATFEHNKAVDERKPAMGVMPGSGLGQLLGRLGRSDRRLLLATVQAAPGPRRDRMERRIRRRVAELGLA